MSQQFEQLIYLSQYFYWVMIKYFRPHDTRKSKASINLGVQDTPIIHSQLRRFSIPVRLGDQKKVKPSNKWTDKAQYKRSLNTLIVIASVKNTTHEAFINNNSQKSGRKVCKTTNKSQAQYECQQLPRFKSSKFVKKITNNESSKRAPRTIRDHIQHHNQTDQQSKINPQNNSIFWKAAQKSQQKYLKQYKLLKMMGKSYALEDQFSTFLLSRSQKRKMQTQMAQNNKM